MRPGGWEKIDWLGPVVEQKKEQWRNGKQVVREKLVKLTVPQVLTALCLLALGVNGLVQAGIQKGMAEKAERLQAQVVKTQELSVEMKEGLVRLPELQEASGRMEATLRQIAAETAGMDGQLAELDRTVAGIDGAVGEIGASTGATTGSLDSARQSSAELLAVLRVIEQVNAGLSADLNGMLTDQQAINRELAEMNRKTAAVPSLLGGGGR